MHFAPAGNTDFLRWKQESVEAQHAQALPGVKRVRLLERRSGDGDEKVHRRSEEHTSELQSLMRISYAVYGVKKTQQATNSKSTSQEQRTNDAITRADTQ